MQAVVIPAYKASDTILAVINRIGREVALIVVVDDACPDGTGGLVAEACGDPRVVVATHEINQGVGGAFLTGMEVALARGAEIVVKVDADGQIDPALIPALVSPIENGLADYVKGNRFFFLSNASDMPGLRLFGNLCLSFLAKLSSGYWNTMDPTNGFFAIQGDVARLLAPSRIAKRFFFETDLLFHLGLLRARVADFPMRAVYGDEVSTMKVSRVFGQFIGGHLRNIGRRVLYKYFVRDFSVASIELVAGAALFGFGLVFGVYHWIAAGIAEQFVPTGTIMIAAVSLLIGFQLVLAFLNYDINSAPREPLHPLLRRPRLPNAADRASAAPVNPDMAASRPRGVDP